jgi:hypothetical protein
MVVFERYHLAPCGINCGTCTAYLRNRNKCSGCMSVNGSNIPHCISCSIRNCELLSNTDSKFCSQCDQFPCRKIKNIDKRYRIRYKTGLIQNLLTINEKGVEAYLLDETKRWTCSSCGAVLSVHKENCLICGEKDSNREFTNLQITTGKYRKK